MPESPIVLPPKYYLDYFQDLLEFLHQHYADILGESDQEFIQQFDRLTEDAKCLFLRFSNRKGPCFRINKLAYDEIKDVSAATYELLEEGFISEELPHDFATFNLFLKKELLEAYPALEPLKAVGKPAIIEQLLVTEASVYDVAGKEPVVMIDKQEEVEFLKLLYFGNYKVPMTEFVVRDVGHVKLEELDDTAFKPWCQSREEAWAFYEISRIKSSIRKAMRLFSATMIHDELGEIPWKYFQQFPHSEKALSKVVLEMGQQLEREKEPELALKYYRLTHRSPAKERQVRILDSIGMKPEAAALAQEMFDNHANASEKIFAKDFLNRPNIRINRSMTARLQGAPSVDLIPIAGINVEQLVIRHFEASGYQAVHSENFLWRNLFGLLYWEELFDQSKEGFHHPLQRRSTDLYHPDFFVKREESFQAKAKALNSRKRIKNKINDTHQNKFGIASPMVHWYDDMLPPLYQLTEKLKPQQIKEMTWEMAKNMKENSKGFPDLFIWNETEYFFYEIKSPNDHLSAQQLFWLERMQELKINADILRVNYHVT